MALVLLRAVIFRDNQSVHGGVLTLNWSGSGTDTGPGTRMVTTHEHARHSFLSGEASPKTGVIFITVGNKGKKESLVTLPWPDDGQAYGSYHPADLD